MSSNLRIGLSKLLFGFIFLTLLVTGISTTTFANVSSAIDYDLNTINTETPFNVSNDSFEIDNSIGDCCQNRNTDYQSPQELSTAPYPFYQFVTLGAIRAYQLWISPSHGSFCPMYPSCSHYAYQAFQDKNILEAFFLAADRLHRCGHDLTNYQAIEVAGDVRFSDPLPDTTSTKETTGINLRENGTEIFQPTQNLFPSSETFIENSSQNGSSEEEWLITLLKN